MIASNLQEEHIQGTLYVLKVRFVLDFVKMRSELIRLERFDWAQYLHRVVSPGFESSLVNACFPPGFNNVTNDGMELFRPTFGPPEMVNLAENYLDRPTRQQTLFSVQNRLQFERHSVGAQ